MDAKKEVQKIVEELGPEAMKNVTGGKSDPIITDTKDVTQEVKDKA